MRALLFAGVSGLLLINGGSAAPVPKGGGVLIEAGNLRLELRSSRERYDGGLLDFAKENLVVNLYLLNRGKEARTLPELRSGGNRIDRAYGVTYFFWFPDGTAIEVVPSLYLLPPRGADEEHQGIKPLVMPGEGYSCGEFNFSNTLTGTGIQERVKKHKGQFCLTAVVAELKLQSNTLSYNGCMLPPAKYVPWTLSRNTPEKVRERKEEARKREERRKSGAFDPAAERSIEDVLKDIMNERLISPMRFPEDWRKN